MANFHPFGSGTYTLNSSISSTQTTITLSSFTEPVSGTPYTMVLLNTDIAYGTIAPKTSQSEFISFTGIVQNGDGTATLTGVTRGLQKKYPFTTDATFKLPHSGQSVFIISNPPQLYEKYVSNVNDETVAGVKTFTDSPIVPSGATGTEAINYNDAAALATAGAADASTSTKGISRLSYSPNVTLGTCTITIATPAVITLASHSLTLNDMVQFTTTGALPTGIVASTTYYVISAGLTANDFEISATQGGSAINTSGTQSGVQTLIKVTPVSVATTDPRVPTQSENDALAGTSGTPSSTNKYETENDTTNGATLTAATISFTASSKTIADSGSGFSTAGFRAGDSLIVTGSGSNNGTYTIVSVAAGSIVVTETLVDESASATVTLATATINKLVRTKSDGTLPYTVLPSGGNLFAGFVAGENITANDAVAIGDGTQADIADTTYNSSNSVNIFAANTTAKWGAFTFTTPTGKNVSLKTVSLSSRQTQNGGQPSPNLTLSIRATSGGLPTGADLDSSVIVDNTYSGGIYQRTFTFTGNYILTQGATYALVFRTAGGSYEVYANVTSTDSGVTWSVPTLNSTPAHVLSAQELLTAGQIWKASALRNNSRLNNFIGFSPNAVTAGNSDKVIGNGFVDGFSGLTAGITYYLSDTNGAISSTSGTYAKKIGRSTKTTQIEMQSKPSLYKWDQPMSVAANYQAITDGFVVGYVVGAGNASVYSDSSATPSVLRQDVGNFSGNAVDRIGFNVPVRKGDYVRVDSSAGTVTIYWMPLS